MAVEDCWLGAFCDGTMLWLFGLLLLWLLWLALWFTDAGACNPQATVNLQQASRFMRAAEQALHHVAPRCVLCLLRVHLKGAAHTASSAATATGGLALHPSANSCGNLGTQTPAAAVA